MPIVDECEANKRKSIRLIASLKLLSNRRYYRFGNKYVELSRRLWRYREVSKGGRSKRNGSVNYFNESMLNRNGVRWLQDRSVGSCFAYLPNARAHARAINNFMQRCYYDTAPPITPTPRSALQNARVTNSSRGGNLSRPPLNTDNLLLHL